MSKSFVAIGAVLVAVTCHAGIKYWDNPDYKAFDVNDYVPGAVWNFDGIRNAGIDQPHSTTATTWANLGSSGSNNDMFIRLQNQAGTGWYNGASTTEPLANLGTINGRDTGSWTENGFTFTGDSELRSKGSINSGTSYTIQMLVDAKIASQTKTKPYLMSVQQNNFAFYVDRANSKLLWGVENSSASDDPFMSGDTLGYVTAILNGTDKTAAFFSGTKIPTSGDGFQSFSSLSGKSDSGYCICGYTGTDGLFKGTMYSYRYYKRVLTEDELAWNRVVDERRFFDRTAPLPVTNAVVATAVAGVEGTEPHGTYAVDVRHTFTAPATVDVGGIDYVCTGYTVEMRYGDGWSTPVFHKAALYQPCAFVVSEGDCVRITWQWAKAAGLKNLGYTVNDYVWDGLETFYDGICNVGTNLPHSYTTTTWVNLGSIGSDNDAFVQRMNAAGNNWETAADLNPVGARNPGYWTDNGFRTDAEGRFRCNDPGHFTVGTDYSLQMLMDAKASDQVTTSSFPFGANNTTFGIQIRREEQRLAWRCFNNYPYLSGDTYDYVTAIMHSDNKQAFFSGTTEPTSGSGYKTSTSAGYSDKGFCLGGYGKTSVADLFVGTLKSFRQYDHALSAEEVAQNRKVDDWRYFGIPDNPNVIVQSTVPYLRGDEPDGSYAVDGSRTFTAPATVTVKGITYACDGYTVEEWNNGNYWTSNTSYSGNSYTYTVGISPALVRLTWKWKATHGLRTAADYSFDDYSQAGLFWNYDGIRNQGGTDEDHDSSAATWKNLGSGGSQFDLSWNGKTSTGEWADDGYIFRGGPRFWNGSTIGPIRNFTLQALVDANTADLPTAKEAHYVMTAMWDNFDLALRTEDNGAFTGSFYCNFNGNGDSKQTTLWFQNDSRHYDFATAMIDYDAKTAQMFQGVDIPTNGTGFCKFQTMTTPHGTTAYGLGNFNTGDQGLVGTLKSFRYYDRVLTEEELVRNRNVDAVRYFHALGVTNVFVVAGGGTQAESGAYKVEGEWTFSATTVLDLGVTKRVEGFYTQTLEDGELSRRTWHDGDSFTYSEADPVYGGKTVYLTWGPRRPGLYISLR